MKVNIAGLGGVHYRNVEWDMTQGDNSQPDWCIEDGRPWQGSQEICRRRIRM